MHCAGRPPGSPKTDPVAMLGHANTILSTFQHEVRGVRHSLAHGTYGTTSKPCSHPELFPLLLLSSGTRADGGRAVRAGAACNDGTANHECHEGAAFSAAQHVLAPSGPRTTGEYTGAKNSRPPATLECCIWPGERCHQQKAGSKGAVEAP